MGQEGALPNQPIRGVTARPSKSTLRRIGSSHGEILRRPPRGIRSFLRKIGAVAAAEHGPDMAVDHHFQRGAWIAFQLCSRPREPMNELQGVLDHSDKKPLLVLEMTIKSETREASLRTDHLYNHRIVSLRRNRSAVTRSRISRLVGRPPWPHLVSLHAHTLTGDSSIDQGHQTLVLLSTRCIPSHPQC